MKMLAPYKSWVLFALALVLMILSQVQIKRIYPLPYPRFDHLSTQRSGFQDAAFIITGFRAAAADIAWIQLLQNMGDYDREGTEEESIGYPFLKEDTFRVTRIDPYFKRAYLFGAATLAYLKTTNRPKEALEVLDEGIRYNPTHWPFHKFVSGIGYKQTNQFGKMLAMLEESVSHPNCPTMVKAILANAYKRHQRYAEAIRLWDIILNDKNGREYHAKAKEEIPKLIAILEQKGSVNAKKGL